VTEDPQFHKWDTAIPNSPKKGPIFSMAKWAAGVPTAPVGLEEDLPYATYDNKEWNKLSRIALFPELAVPEGVEKNDGILAIELATGRKGWVCSEFIETGRLVIDQEDTMFVAQMKGLLTEKGWNPFYLCSEDIQRLRKDVPSSFSEHLLPYDPVSPRFWYGESCETCGQPYQEGSKYDMCHSCQEPRGYTPPLNLNGDYE